MQYSLYCNKNRKNWRILNAIQCNVILYNKIKFGLQSTELNAMLCNPIKCRATQWNLLNALLNDNMHAVIFGEIYIEYDAN